MAKALWEQEINKTVDWAGDTSTGGAAVSGFYVQKFIKDTLNKKFGYLYFNAENKKYYVFADREDYLEWVSDQSGKANLILATFDAPAPASIKLTLPENLSRTVLYGEEFDPITFKYFIADSSGNPQAEQVILRVYATAKTAGVTRTDVVTLPIDYTHFMDEENGGSEYSYTRISRLLTSDDNYDVTFTLTTSTTQVSASFTMEYKVVNLSISNDFDYLTAIDFSKSSFSTNVITNGGTGLPKILNLYIDGVPFKQIQRNLGWPAGRLVSTGYATPATNKTDTPVEFFIRKIDGTPITWADMELTEDDFTKDGSLDYELFAKYNKDSGTKKNDPIFEEGIHTLQMYAEINSGSIISSKVLYSEFVVIASTEENKTYLLYKTEVNEVTSVDSIVLQGTQYKPITFSVGAINTRNNAISVSYDYYIQSRDDDGNLIYDSDNNPVFDEDPIEQIPKVLNSGTQDDVKYTLKYGGAYNLKVTSPEAEQSLNIIIISKEANFTINEIETGNIYKYSAMNRSNDDPKKAVWSNTSTLHSMEAIYKADATFNDHMTFVKGKTGWNDDTLILKNNATVTFPINLFKPTSDFLAQQSGFTFEIDFETFDVQEDEAEILIYDDPGYKSSLKIFATSAQFTTNAGTTIKTNFKDGERTKIAFIMNKVDRLVNNKVVDSEGNVDTDDDNNPNTLFIMVNGVLDRVVKYGTGSGAVTDDSIAWANPQGPNKDSFTIGNVHGKAGVKIHSIRIYNRALKLDEEFQNYLNDADGDNITKIYEKNNILDGGEISVDSVKGMIPTMVVATDYVGLCGLDAARKKANTFAEVQFFNPIEGEENIEFYARQCWMSCQGTSSMAYPVKNLRLYFGKTKNKNTFQDINVIKKIGSDVYTPIDKELYTTPEFATEFWPASEYANAGSEAIESYTDKLLPYGTNKKADGDEGSEILVSDKMTLCLHEGYHKIGANRTVEGKVTLVNNYLSITNEYDSENIVDGKPEANQRVQIFKIDLTKSPLKYKDAFGDEHIAYSISKIAGYKQLEDGTYSDSWSTKLSVNCFVDCTDELIGMTEDARKTYLTNFLKSNDLFISAYRPLLHRGESITSNSYKDYIKQLLYSGVKIFTKVITRDEEGNITQITYERSKKFKENTLFYSLGSNWRQYNYSGWTDRWTLKADYAESSMCHNAGVGRLWGNAMRNVNIDTHGYVGKKCMTRAQEVVGDVIDIRTSCDGKPIVLFYKQINGFDEETGRPTYANPKFAGLYNIMTDKSSTKLFGFEDIKNEKGETIFEASNTECWECTNNGSNVIKGLSPEFDESKGENNLSGIDLSNLANVDRSSLGKKRPLWDTYESRWPDTGQERHAFDPSSNPLGNNWPDDVYGVDTKNLEGFLRWVNFTKDALNFTIGEGNQKIDGYTGDVFVKVTGGPTQLTAIWNAYNRAIEDNDEDAKKTNMLYLKWDKSGNTVYTEIGGEYQYVVGNETKTDTVQFVKTDDNGEIIGYEFDLDWYTKMWQVDMSKVNKSLNTEKIATDVYLVPIPSFDAKCRCTDEKTGETDEAEQQKYYVDTYVTPTGDGRYKYLDDTGTEQIVTGAAIGLDPDIHIHTIDGNPLGASNGCKGKTYMQYFSATKSQHLDLPKVAAYYIYLIRFGAVDQVVKNSMMTTEDGQHYYFINYDNDTILGVRNDGLLVYNWDIDRNSYDDSLPGYAFAGAQSVLWNNLEMDEEFMDMVKDIDNALSKQGLLSADAVLTWFNERQEGTWSERLYNAQEKIKYLSTVKDDFTTDKYLGFMHGPRHAHRSWWVNHRWELYDAKWSSGMYSNMKSFMKFIVDSATRQAPVDLIAITAASKYHFTMMKNTSVLNDSWIKELKANESGTYSTTEPIQIGDPMYLLGTHKIKILNFRPIAAHVPEINLIIGYKATDMYGNTIDSNWYDDNGSLMTKLLIGWNDIDESATAPTIGGLNRITSLEEVDIRGMKKLNDGEPVISALANLHRWRSKNAHALTFEPASGVNLYEVSLSNELTSIALNDVTFMEDPNEYIPIQSDIKSGRAGIDDFAQTYGDFLPTYGESAYKYCLEGNHFEFDYAPTENLNSVIFNNVKGLDTLQFVYDWIAKLKAKGKSTINCKLNISGVDWTIKDTFDEEGNVEKTAVENFIELYRTFDITDTKGEKCFRGIFTLDLKESEDGAERSLTPEEFEKLTTIFGEEAFKPGNNKLVINCPAGMFLSVTGQTSEGNASIGSLGTHKFYNYVQGNELKINASIFPVSEELEYVYALGIAGGYAGYDPNTSIILDKSLGKGKEIYTLANGDIKLENNINGYATLTATAGKNIGTGENDYLVINVLGYQKNNPTQPDRNNNYCTKFGLEPIYIKIAKKIMPRENEVHIYEGTTLADTGDYTIVNSEDHEFTIQYTSNPKPNVKIDSISVSFNDTNANQHDQSTYDIENDETITYGLIKPYTNGEYVSIDNDEQKFKFTVNHDILYYYNNPDVNIYIKMKYENGEIINKTLHYNVLCIPASSTKGIGLYEVESINEETREITYSATATSNIVIDKLGTRRYVIMMKSSSEVYDYNIKYESELNAPTGISGFSVEIENGYQYPVLTLNVNCNKTTSVPDGMIGITMIPEIHNENVVDISRDFGLILSIFYPDTLEMSRVTDDGIKLVANSTMALSSDIFDIGIADGKSISSTDGYLYLNTKALGNQNVTIDHAIYVDKVTITTSAGSEDYHPNGSTTIEAIDAPNADESKKGTLGLKLIYDENPVEIEGVEVPSVSALKITSNQVNGVKNEATVKVDCKVAFDVDPNNDNDIQYMSFNNSEVISFTFKIRRSLASGTSYKKLDSFDAHATDTIPYYQCYAVTKDNEFYSIKIDSTFTATAESLNALDPSRTMINNDEWVGVGFIINRGGNVINDENSTNRNPIPYFISLKKYIAYRYTPSSNINQCSILAGDTAAQGNPTYDKLGAYYNNNGNITNQTLYNGNYITNTIVSVSNTAKPQYTIDIVDTLFNTVYNDGLYIPSYKEISTIVNANETNMKLMNAALQALTEVTDREMELIFGDGNEYEISNIPTDNRDLDMIKVPFALQEDSIFTEISAHNSSRTILEYMFGTGTRRYIDYGSSTIHNAAIMGRLYKYGVSYGMNEDNSFEIKQTDQGVKDAINLVVIPFVKVQ